MRRFAPLVATAVLASCGKTGPLRPPVPHGPLPPGQVAARQIGAGAEVAFTVPKPRGSAPSQEMAKAEILRVSYPPGVVPSVDPEAFRVRGEVVVEVPAEALTPGRRLVIADTSLHSLGDGGIGWTLRYGVRVRDQHGRPSALVAALDLPTLTAGAAPRDLKGLASADGVRLSWAPPEGLKGASFNLYRGLEDDVLAEQPLNVKPLAAGEYLDTTTESGKRYRYVVRTVLADGVPYREGPSSGQVVVDASDVFPPAAPKGLVAVQEGSAIRLLWDPSTERDLDGDRVYRKVGDGEWTRIGPDPLRQPTYLDHDVTPGSALAYRVTAIDRATPPNEGAPSTEESIRLAAEPSGGARP